jgi:hypothetical protein
MDIETLKDKLGDETFAKLQTYVTDLIGQRDTARNESITGRKGMKTELETLRSAQAKLMEKLGVESLDDIDALPDAKGAADAAKQYGTQIKRLERQLAEAQQKEQEATGKYRSSLQRASVAEAMGGHEFVARDIVETYVGQRLTWEGDELLFKADDGKLLPVKDGVAGIAKTRPELLKASGTGGSGARTQTAGSGSGAKTMTRAEFDALPPAQRMDAAVSGVQLV